MAAPIHTPKKETIIGSFICHRSALTITFSLSGRKCASLFGNLSSLISNETVYNCISQASVCRSCFTRLEKTLEFVKEVKEGAERYARGNISSKRLALTPITPKSNPNNSDVSVITNRSRKFKKLNFAQTDDSGSAKEHRTFQSLEHNVPDKIQDPISLTSTANEHGYAACSTSLEEDTTSDILSHVKESFENLCCSEVDPAIGKLRHQASSLTSRTTLFSSVLYKYRNIVDFHNNANRLLCLIVEEMRNSCCCLLCYWRK
ncbi:uncharacterized protein [Argopecten irradians]|uniref:uncharacterized protein n=1 Tax=Argopecten irradians TaxID=31199 RepID=UPI0037156864